ncbi:hypothetical protein [Bifidobacterium magnum]|nr:hypothetical protein [Bifidobacterium magnum]
MKFAPIYDPSHRRPAPKPVQVDLRKVFMAGTALWALALIICSILMFLGFGHMLVKVQICAFGTAAGICLLIWEFFDRWDYRRLGADD